MTKRKLLIGLMSAGMSAHYAAHALTLQETVQKTVQTHPNVLANASERRSIDHELEQARAGYFPRADISLGIGREHSDNPSTRAISTTEPNLTRGEAALTVSQMLFDSFAVQSEVARQQARVSSSAYKVYGTAEATGLRAVEVYLEVLRRQELVALAKDNLLAHQRTYDQVKLRSEGGVGRKADLHQVEGRLALAQSNLLAEEGNLRNTETNYLRVVGEAAQGLVKPADPAGSGFPKSEQEALQQALANHPILKSAIADVAAAQAQHEASKSKMFPRFDLELSTSSDNNIDGIQGTNQDYATMVRMRYNLFAGGADLARENQTAQLIQQAGDIRDNTHRQVEESVRLSWNAFTTARERLVPIKQHMDSSEQTRDDYRKQFNIGQRTLLDLLDSENELFTARSDYVNAQYTELFGKYRVLADMGKLNESLNVKLPEEATVASTAE
jgi:adhesin transport system outer membrane protein